MYFYIVQDIDEGHIWGLYDEEGIKKEYPNLVRNPPYYRNKDYWIKDIAVWKCKLNSEEREDVEPEDIMPEVKNR